MVQSLNVSGVINAFRIIWNPSLAMPHIIVQDIRSIQYSTLKSVGNIKAIGFDKDNCLTEPYVSTIYPPFKAEHLEKSLGVTVLKHKEKKPAGGEHLRQYLDPILPEETAFVGDRILTDVVFGNQNGNLTIWTSRVITEKGDNKAALILRRMEYKLIAFLQKLNVKPPPHSALMNNLPSDFIQK